MFFAMEEISDVFGAVKPGKDPFSLFFSIHVLPDVGVSKKLVGLIVDGDPFIGGCASPWRVMSNNQICGKVSSAAYSPRLKINMAMATIDNGNNEINSEVIVETPWGLRSAKVTSIPFN